MARHECNPCQSVESDGTSTSSPAAWRAKLEKYCAETSPLQKYDVGPVVGIGSTGVVRRLTDPQTGTKYACKLVKLRASDDSDQTTGTSREDVLREVAATCGLCHPGIARLVEYHETDTRVAIVTELLQGEDLQQALHLTGEPLSEDDARVLTRKLLETLRYLHSNGVIHRDLKLENVVLAKSRDMSSAKITDFGLAYRSPTKGHIPRLVDGCGSPAYVAPEVLRAGAPSNRGDKYYGKECDLWSLGVLLFVVLSGGLLPFTGRTIKELYSRILAADFDFEDDPAWLLVSPDAKDFLCGLLRIDPADRLTIEEALQHPWLSKR